MTCIDYCTHTYDLTEELADMWLAVEDERRCQILALSPWERALLEASLLPEVFDYVRSRVLSK
jgi:hypothetical protein